MDEAKRPLIGITCNYDPTDRVGIYSNLGTKGQDMNYVALDYADCIAKAGGVPVFVPQYKSPELAEELVYRLDGLLVSGGDDVDPALYGEAEDENSLGVNPARDHLDIALIKAAVSRKMPLLGICRGTQIINVAFGGTLHKDVEQDGFRRHMFMENDRNVPVHTIKLEKGSLLEAVYGRDRVEVNSFHHQAVKDPGQGVAINGYSEDGVPEVIQLAEGHPFSVAVQWHPEMMFDSEEQAKLFRAFVAACRG